MHRFAIASLVLAAFTLSGLLGGIIVLSDDAPLVLANVQKGSPPGPICLHQNDIAYAPGHDRWLSFFPTNYGTNMQFNGLIVSPDDGSFIYSSDDLPWNAYTGDIPVAEPAIAWNAVTGRFLAVFVNASGLVHGCVYNESGSMIGLGGSGYTCFPISDDAGSRPRVACNGADWLVVWEAEGDVWGRSVQGDTNTVIPLFQGGPFPIAQEPAVEKAPVVARIAGKEQFLVVWLNATAGTIEGRMVQPGAGGGGLRRFDATVAERTCSNPSVAANDDTQEFIVAWADHGASDGEPWIRAATCDADPIGVPVAVDPNPARNVMADGITVGWSKGASQVFLAWFEEHAAQDGRFALRAARLNAWTYAVMASGINIADPSVPATYGRGPSMADRGDVDGTMILQWREDNGASPVAVNAQRYDLGSPPPPPPPSPSPVQPILDRGAAGGASGSCGAFGVEAAVVLLLLAGLARARR